MAITNISKGIAGAVAGIAVAWLGHFTGMTLPVETVAWVETTLASVIAGGVGFLIVYLSPPNKPS
jgi:hypothetical protein